jgi:hypothetical protein
MSLRCTVRGQRELSRCAAPHGGCEVDALEVGDHQTRTQVLPRNLRRRDVRSLTDLIIGLSGCTPLKPLRD